MTIENELLERQIDAAKRRMLEAYQAGKKSEAKMHCRVFYGLLRRRPPEVIKHMEKQMFGTSF